MARRPAFTPDEARTYLAQAQHEGRIRSIPTTAREQQRLARGLSQGKTVAQARGHGKSESRPAERTRSIGRRYTYPATYARMADKQAWRIGPNIDVQSRKTADEGLDPNNVRGRIPQPDDLIRHIMRHTRKRTIMVGLHGYIIIYMDPNTDEPLGWLYPHTLVNRDWLLQRLRQLPLDHQYTASDPAYLQLAHDIFGGERQDVWMWGYVFQWSVRDV